MNTHSGDPSKNHAMHWLSVDQSTANVLWQARRLLELEKSLKKAVPGPLAQNVSVIGFHDGLLEVTTYNSAQTAKLRQLKQSICDRMMRDGWNIKDIKLRISAQPAPGSTQSKAKRQTRPLQTDDLQHFETLAKELKPGSLADAVKTLLERHKSG